MNKVLFNKGYHLEFGKGRIDNWCVYLCRHGKRVAPKDYVYFEGMIIFSKKYGVDTIYDDFVEIYKKTSKSFSQNVCEYIKSISKKYKKDSLNISIMFTLLYMTMIAEENKKNAILGKRVKRLGVYQILFDNMSIYDATVFSKNKGWRILDNICRYKGF